MDPSSHVLSDFNFALSDFNFDAVGDWGCNSNTQSTVNNIKGKNPEDKSVKTGDVINSTGE